MTEKPVTKEMIVSDIKKVSKLYKKQFPKNKGNVTRDYYRSKGKYKEGNVIEVFGSFKNAIEEIFPKEIKVEEEKHDRDSFSIKKTNKDFNKRFFISSIIAGMSVNEKFMQAILNYCNINNAELVLLVMRGVKKDDVISEEVFLKYNKYFHTEYTFNDNLKALDFFLAPQQIITLTGISRISKKGCSLILGHSKQFLEVVPSRIGTYPHIVYSTGTICLPSYSHDRVGKIAQMDHLQGGIIAEIKDKKVFHVRSVQCDSKNTFVDLGKLYSSDSVQEIETSLIMGDGHIGSQCDIAFDKTVEIINELKCKNIYFNDLIDARSVSHHEEHNLKAQYSRPEHQQSLNKELSYVGNFLKNLFAKIKHPVKYISVPSNHNEHLDRFLYEGRFVFSSVENCKLACELFPKYLDGENPIKYFLESRRYIEKDKIAFPTRDDELTCYGWVVTHGDKGSNGSCGSSKVFDKTYERSVTAHSHSPSIFRSSVRVGTLSKLQMHYISGSGSSWLHTSCILNSNGTFQLLNIINGEWRL